MVNIVHPHEIKYMICRKDKDTDLDEYFTFEKMLRKMQIQDIKLHTKHL